MAKRKITDAKDTTTNEVIYFKGHAKATYMSDGRSVEDAIYSIGSGGSGGGGVVVRVVTEEQYAAIENKNDGVLYAILEG